MSGWYIPVARKYAVMFAGRMVLAYFAWDVVQDATWIRKEIFVSL